jgi:hypothetical protein
LVGNLFGTSNFEVMRKEREGLFSLLGIKLSDTDAGGRLEEFE